MDLLRQIEAELNADFSERRRAHAAAVERANASREAWQKEVRAAQKDGRPSPSMPAEADEPDPLSRIRLLATDVTPEKLVRLLLPNPRGLLYFRDELAGWLGSMDRYGGNGSERALWLEAYNGRPYVVDRVKDPEPIQVPRLTVALAGGIQPDRLASGLLAGDDDGLAARILYFWPEPVPPQRPKGAVDDTTALAAMRRLRDLGMAVSEASEPCPQILTLTDDAATALQTFREDNANAERGATGTYLSWLGKLPGVACRLALILEHLWWAGDPNRVHPPGQITKAAVLGAIALITDCLTPMAERTFGDAALPRAEKDAATIARWIARERPEIVNVRDLRRRKLPGLGRADEVRVAVAELVEASWLLPEPTREGGSVGRRREDLRVNPRLWELIE